MDAKLFNTKVDANVDKVCRSINNPLDMPVTFDLFNVND